jgi:dienelactone hydrolase
MAKKTVHELEEKEVAITVGPVEIDGNLVIPEEAVGIVLFAHGSGSGRFSPRNRFVAELLHQQRLATLLIDLLTPEEDTVDQQTGELRFNIPLLSARLIGATDWLAGNPETRELKIGYFGASTGAAAALMAEVERPRLVKAIVSRGGRPDLAWSALQLVKAPTLLIVGGYDFTVIELNRRAFAQLNGEKYLTLVPGATHLFEEAGALEEVARLSADWFLKHLK